MKLITVISLLNSKKHCIIFPYIGVTTLCLLTSCINQTTRVDERDKINNSIISNEGIDDWTGNYQVDGEFTVKMTVFNSLDDIAKKAIVNEFNKVKISILLNENKIKIDIIGKEKMGENGEIISKSRNALVVRFIDPKNSNEIRYSIFKWKWESHTGRNVKYLCQISDDCVIVYFIKY